MKTTISEDYTKFTKNSQRSIELWFDSTKEAQDFKHFLEVNETKSENIDNILTSSHKFVKHKTKYRSGIYWPLQDIDKMVTSDQLVKTSQKVTKIIEWQHHDHIITNCGNPLLTIETTDHEITWNNVAQRIPRLMQSVSCGVPSIIFQRIGNRSTIKNKGWFLQSLVNATTIFGIPCVAILYDDSSRKNAEKKLSCIITALLDYVYSGKEDHLQSFNALLQTLQDENKHYADAWFNEKTLKNAGWLEISKNEVKVLIGVNPGASMWKTKGTGGLDPYPGLVAMTDLLLCRTGPQKSDRRTSLTVEFKNIKEDFWWFKQYPTELYLQMLIDPSYRMADKVIFKK